MTKQDRKALARLAMISHHSGYDATLAWALDHLIFRTAMVLEHHKGLNAPEWLGTREYHRKWKREWLELARESARKIHRTRNKPIPLP